MTTDKKKKTQINFKDEVNLNSKTVNCPVTNPEPIIVSGEVKVFGHKYANTEAECVPGTLPSKGDDIAYTFVFGNYGELTYNPCNNDSTVVDTLTVECPINLKLMNICTCDDFKLFNAKTGMPVKRCDIFYGGIVYKLEVRKLKKHGDPNCYEDYEAAFPLPCHSIYSISMLFQIDFPACPPCPGDKPMN